VSILSGLVSLVVKKRARQIESVLENELELMEEKLTSILKRHEGTYFGRRHGFDTISSPAAYSDKVLLMDYAYLERYLEMVYQDPNAGVLTLLLLP
jgi:hypothetical protein